MNKKAIALGFFDGLHIGHASLLNKVKQRAAELGVEPAILTFDTHPDTLVQKKAVMLISSPEERAYEVKRLFGIEEVISLHFDEEMMNMEWTDFIDRMANDYAAAHFVVGYDFRFGRGGIGSAQKLKFRCAEAGIGCDIMPEVRIDGITVSSTYIRHLLETGDMDTARRFLGHPYSLTDTVSSGHRLGSEMGTPTINLHFPEGVLIPRFGVYATRVFIQGDDKDRFAVTNIGVRPTVSGDGVVSVESYILDFNKDIYGKKVRLEFYDFLRPERKFSGVEELKRQILTDAGRVREYFGI
ncbi:MAG: bifunctional riboflavin kinase/FAD synthetase [Clostridiales bacterium]|nr:bifunctional riboflavin kinase/FAD synthetase [Clostridiales bacterium]